MNKLKMLLTLFAVVLALQGCKENLKVGEPAEQYEAKLEKLLGAMDDGSVSALVSDDELFMIVTVDEQLDSINDEAVVVFKVGDEEFVVNEEKWREKYGYKKDERCPLFSQMQEKVFTFMYTPKGSDKEQAVYVVVSDELCEYQGEANEGMFVSAHAYTINDGDLETIKIFNLPDGMSDSISTEPEEYHSMYMPGLWPASLDEKDDALRLARSIYIPC